MVFMSSVLLEKMCYPASSVVDCIAGTLKTHNVFLDILFVLTCVYIYGVN